MGNTNVLLDGKAQEIMKDVYHLGEGGTTVIANPQLSGDEADLTGLQVGDTKYVVPQGSSETPHLYVYEISIELADDPGSIYTALMFSKNYYENFDINKGQTSTITFDQFLNDIYDGLDFGGMVVYDIDLTNKTFGLSGASVYGANDVTFIRLTGKQIF